jgi:hypothetical protein
MMVMPNVRDDYHTFQDLAATVEELTQHYFVSPMDGLVLGACSLWTMSLSP